MMQHPPVRIAIAGVGNCASSLIQGISYYSKRRTAAGIMHRSIGGYRPEDMRIVAAFDVHERKVGSELRTAIFMEPNCTQVFEKNVTSRIRVSPGPILDGVTARTRAAMRPHGVQRPLAGWRRMIVRELRESGASVLVSYLPVGSERASKFYAECALEAGVAFANAIPVFICSTPAWSERFRRAGLPCAGDDIKSQVGATIVHRALVDLVTQRGMTIDDTFQLNVGGNTDFLNMLDESRLRLKRVSKTEAVASMSPHPLRSSIGPSGHIPYLADKKVAYIQIRGRQFGGVAFSMDLKLSVEDSPNSAGVMMDVIRLLQLARDRGLSGHQDFSSYYFKHPARQMRDDDARRVVEDFIA